jgi:hypothetical protein
MEHKKHPATAGEIRPVLEGYKSNFLKNIPKLEGLSA